MQIRLPTAWFLLLGTLAFAAIVSRGGNAPVPQYWYPQGASVGLTVVASAQIGQTATAATGTDFTPLLDLAANQCRVWNMSGSALEFRRGPAGFTFQIPAGGNYVFRAITNTNQLQVRREDQIATPVNVTYEAESATP